jgi:hypothetical protein
MSRVKLLLLLLLAILCALAYGANPARPGSINYIEGSALVAGAPVTQKSVGTLPLDPGQVLSTSRATPRFFSRRGFTSFSTTTAMYA